jgi:hypothetical protein
MAPRNHAGLENGYRLTGTGGQIVTWVALLFVLLFLCLLPFLIRHVTLPGLAKLSPSSLLFGLCAAGMTLTGFTPMLSALLVVGLFPGAGGVRMARFCSAAAARAPLRPYGKPSDRADLGHVSPLDHADLSSLLESYRRVGDAIPPPHRDGCHLWMDVQQHERESLPCDAGARWAQPMDQLAPRGRGQSRNRCSELRRSGRRRCSDDGSANVDPPREPYGADQQEGS